MIGSASKGYYKVEYTILMTSTVTGCDSWHSLIRRGIKNEQTALANARTVDWGYLDPGTFHDRLLRNRHVRAGHRHGNPGIDNYSNGDAHDYECRQPILASPCCCQG